MSSSTIGVQEIHTVGVPVTDQDRALDFYTGRLGLTVGMDVPIGPGRRWITVAAPRGTAVIALVAASPEVPAGVETGIRLVSRDVDTDHAALRAAGVDADEVLRWPGVPAMFAFRDPDGNGLEIIGEAGP
jgi:catechol 2,3-dioxygenase-like lactoylglutathione lyase family enzyme